jgi:hypothetical protein
MEFPARYRTIEDLPEVIPLFPLGGVLLLPRAHLPLNVFEPRYLAMVDYALSGYRMVGMIQPKGQAAIAAQGDPKKRPPLVRVGCVGRICAYAETGDGRLTMTLAGVCRFVVARERRTVFPFRLVEPDFSPYAADLEEAESGAEVDREALIATFRAFLDAHDLSADWDEVRSASTEELVNALSMLAPYGPEDKQALLEAASLQARAELLIALTERALSHRAGASPRLQ